MDFYMVLLFARYIILKIVLFIFYTGNHITELATKIK